MLELSSNNVKVLGIFGRLSSEQEAYFDELEKKYSSKPDKSLGYDIFRHLTLTFEPNAPVSSIRTHLNLLRDLKPYLPVKLNIEKVFVKDEESMEGAEHIAVEFGLGQTKQLVGFIKDKVGDSSVVTWYTKVVWFVPKENQQKVIDKLSDLKTIEFTDFYLVANKQNDDNTIFKTSDFR
jgi:hypothetical protein